MGRTAADGLPNMADCLCHGGNGVSALPWITGMGCDSLYGQFKPGPALMGYLNLAVRWFRIQYPVFPVYPAVADSAFHSPHKIFLIHGSYEYKGTRRKLPCASGQFHHI